MSLAFQTHQNAKRNSLKLFDNKKKLLNTN